MALIESTRARLHPTPAERLALALATWISVGVAERMARRAQRLTDACTASDAAALEDVAATHRDREHARACLLGIR